MTTPPKKHHYVPQLLLRNFAAEDGMLWTYSDAAAEAGVRQSRPEGIFAKNHLYTERKLNGEKDTSLEAAYGKIESDAAPVIVKIVDAARKGSLASLTGQEREAWDTFFIAQIKRTPDATRRLRYEDDFAQVLDEILNGIEEEHGIPVEEKARVFRELNTKDGRQTVRVKALSQPNSDQVTEAVKNSTLSVAAIQLPNRSFALGSSPTIKLSDNHGLLGDSAPETWLPIARDIAVCITFQHQGRGVFRVAEDGLIRAVNEASFLQSSAIASTSERLLKSLVKAHKRKH